MSYDSIVSAQDVLNAIRLVNQTGLSASLSSLEQREPELLLILTEEASNLNHQLRRFRVPLKHQLRFTHRIERLGLHLVLALESGQRRLWSDLEGGKPPSTLR